MLIFVCLKGIEMILWMCENCVYDLLDKFFFEWDWFVWLIFEIYDMGESV